VKEKWRGIFGERVRAKVGDEKRVVEDKIRRCKDHS